MSSTAQGSTHINIDEASPEIKASREASDNFQAAVALLAAFLWRGIEAYDFSSSRCGVGKDFRDLQGM